jgi:LTXXQ motif family protein
MQANLGRIARIVGCAIPIVLGACVISWLETLSVPSSCRSHSRAMMAGAAPQTLLDRLTLQEKWLAARLEGIRAIRPALTILVGTLSDEQKKMADELLAPHMGMMAMMSAMSGQMSPGQMQPGMMMPAR